MFFQKVTFKVLLRKKQKESLGKTEDNILINWTHLWKHAEEKAGLNKPFMGRKEVVYTLKEFVSGHGEVWR